MRTRTWVRVAAVAVLLVLGDGVLVLTRALVNLPLSAASVAWGRTHGGTCELSSDLTTACRDMDGGYANGGTTVGSTWLYGDLADEGRRRHEARHATQWAVFGSAFAGLYGVESVRTGGDFHDNVFERSAGLSDGGYGR